MVSIRIGPIRGIVEHAYAPVIAGRAPLVARAVHAPGIPARASRRCAGFTYLGLLFWVAVTGAGLAAVGTVWHTSTQRERERELLFVGAQFREAIASYYEASPGAKQYPRTLEDLVQDPRFPSTRRHLRRIYRDPITGETQWGLIKQGDWLLGVHSLSEERPIKQAQFELADALFQGSTRYSAWRFIYSPAGFQSPGAAAIAGAERRAPVNFEPDAPLPMPAASGVAAPPRRQAPRLATEGWVCTANRANELRACARAPVHDCIQEAQHRYRECMASAVDRPQSAGVQ